MAVATTQSLAELRTQKPGSPIVLAVMTGVTAVGDQTITFDRPFSAAPTVLAVTLTGNGVTQTAGDYPTVTVKTTTTTTCVLSFGGVFNSKTFGANVLLQGDL